MPNDNPFDVDIDSEEKNPFDIELHNEPLKKKSSLDFSESFSYSGPGSKQSFPSKLPSISGSDAGSVPAPEMKSIEDFNKKYKTDYNTLVEFTTQLPDENTKNFFQDIKQKWGINDQAAMLALQKKYGNPKISVEKAEDQFAGRSHYNALANKMILTDFQHYLAELSHSKQNKDGEMTIGRIIKDFIKSPYVSNGTYSNGSELLGIKGQYSTPGTLENEAHGDHRFGSGIQDEMWWEFNNLRKQHIVIYKGNNPSYRKYANNTNSPNANIHANSVYSANPKISTEQSDNTRVETVVPPFEGMTQKKQVEQHRKALEKHDPIGRISLYTNAIEKINNRFNQNLDAYTKAKQAGDEETASQLLPLLKEDGMKSAYYKKAIDGQNTLALMKEPDTYGNAALIGIKQAVGGLLRGPQGAKDAAYILSKDALAKVGVDGEKFDALVNAYHDSQAAIGGNSDGIAQLGKELLKEADKSSQERALNQEYHGSAWEALKHGDITKMADYGAKGFIQSLPSSLAYLHPVTAATASAGMIGQEIDQAIDEGREVNSGTVAAGAIKAGLEFGTERMFGVGKSTRDLISTMTKEGAAKVVKEATEKAVRKTLKQKLGRNYVEEVSGEVVNQIGNNAVDKYINGKDISMGDGIGDAALIAAFGAGTQGTTIVTAKHYIDKSKIQEAQVKKEQAASMVDESAHQEDPIVAQTLEDHAAKLNKEADEVITKQNEIGDNAKPETVEQINDNNAKIDGIEKALASDIPQAHKEVLATELESLNKEGEALAKKAEEEAQDNINKNDSKSDKSLLKQELEKINAPQKIIDAIPEDTKLRESFLTDTKRLSESILGLAGNYNGKDNEIKVGKFYSALSGGRDKVLLHEAVHAATISNYSDILNHPEDYSKEQSDAVNKLNDIALEYMQNTSGSAKIIPRLYGTTNPQEFIAEFVSNKKFRDWVSKNSPDNKTNAVSYIWKNILSLLGIKKDQINDDIIQNIEKGIDATLSGSIRKKEGLSTQPEIEGQNKEAYNKKNEKTATKEETYSSKDSETPEELKEQLVKAGKITLDNDGKVEDVRQNSGASSHLFQDLTEIATDKDKALNKYLQYKNDTGPFKKESDWENKIMRDYGRNPDQPNTYSIERPDKTEIERHENDYAWSSERNGKPVIFFNDNFLSRKVPFKEQKQGYIDKVINPEIEEYRKSDNKEALNKMEEYKKLFEENVKSNRDLKLHLIHLEMYGIQNVGKEITPKDIDANYIRSVGEAKRLAGVKLAKDYFGEPMIFAHSGPEGITSFKKPGEDGYEKNDDLTGQEGIYFSRDIRNQEKYAGFNKGKPAKDKDIYYTFLKYKNAYHLDDPQAQEKYPLTDIAHITTEQRKKLEELGYDAIIKSSTDRPKEEVVVFSPDQVEIIGSYNKGLINKEIASNGDTNTNGEIKNAQAETERRQGEDVLSVPAGETKSPAVELSDEQKTKDNTEAEKLGFSSSPHGINSINKREKADYKAWSEIPAEIKDKVSNERKEEKSKKEKDLSGNNNSDPGVPPEGGETQTVEDSEPIKGKRKYTDRFLDNKNIREDIKEAVSKDADAVYYNKLPNNITEREANQIIESFGVDDAIRQFLDPESSISLPVRNVLGFAIINNLNNNKEYARAAEVALEIEKGVARAGTEAAQSLQSFKIWYRIHPASAVIHGQKMVRQQREKKIESDKKLPKIKKELKKINEDSIKEVIEKVVGKIDAASKIHASESISPPKYGESNRFVTKKRYLDLKKKLRGNFHSGLNPELVELAAFHLEASGRKFNSFAQQMIKDLGTKIRPYLKSLYDKAKADLEKAGYEDFDSAESVDTQFSGLLKNPVKEGLKDMNIRIQDIITQHYTIQDYTGQTLANKLIEQTGLTNAEATDLSNAINKEFNRIATEAKHKMLARIFGEKKVREPDIKNLEDEIIKLTNLGAFSDEELTNKYAEKMGWPTLTESNVKEIERLALKVQQTPDGFQKDERIQDLLSYQANLKGMDWTEIPMAIWYANMLSGISTQAKNIVSNTVNTTTIMAGTMIQHPSYSIDMAKAYLTGMKRGVLEASNTLKTGYSPVRGKSEIPSILERKKWSGFGNALQYHKHVRRVMVAADVISYEAAKEMKAYQLALKQSINDNDLTSKQSIRNKTAEILGLRDFQQQESREQAELEYNNKAENISQSDLSYKEKKAAMAKADKDLKRRTYELIEQKRPADIFEDSHSFAKKATYNAPPEGVLGLMSNAMNWISSKASAFKLIVPFTNLISNVANEAINYTPLGFVGSATNRGGVFTKAKNFTEQDRIDLTVKASIGTALMTAAFILSGSDDDDDPVIQITANGYGDFAKNEALRATGWQQYSIKIGNKWVSYQYTPFALGMAYIGNIRDFEKYREAKIDDKFWTKYGVAARWTTRTMLDATAVSSLDNFMGAIMDGRDENAIGTLSKSAVRTAKSFVIPAIAEQEFRRMEDWFNIPDKETQGTAMGQVWRNIPFARDKYFNKVNALGREIPPDADVFISGLEEDSEIFKTITDKGLTIQAPSFNKMVINDPETNLDRKLTQEEFYDFSRERGKLIREKLESESKYFEKMSNEAAKDYLKDVINDASQDAKYYISHSKQEYDTYNKFSKVESDKSVENKVDKAEKESKRDERLAITRDEIALRDKLKGLSHKKLVGELLTLKNQDPSIWTEKRKRYERLDIIPPLHKKEGGLTEFGRLLKEANIDLN